MDKIKEIVATATSKLQDDFTIHAEVAAELTDHLADSAAEHESEDEAIKHFGDPQELAGALFSANWRRFKWHSLLKKAAKIAIVPLILLSWYLAFDFDTFAIFKSLNSLSGNHSSSFLEKITKDLPSDPQKAFLITGDTSKTTPAEQMKALWQSDPTNKMYFATYFDQISPDENNIAEYKQAIETGLKLDPDNAMYNYRSALQSEYMAENTVDDEYIVTITDRKKFDQAMQNFALGFAKPYMTNYSQERAEQLIMLYDCQKPKNFTGFSRRLLITARMLLPNLSTLRSVTRQNLLYAETLINEGNPAEAEVYLDAWRPMLRQLNATKDTSTFIGQLVLGAVAGVYYEKAPALYRLAGNEAKAVKTEQQLKPLVEHHRQFMAAKKSPEMDAYKSMIAKHGGLMANLMLPGLIITDAVNITPEMFTPERLLNYVWLDSAVLLFFTFALTIIIIFLLLIWVIDKLRKKNSAGIIMPLSSYLKVLLFGVLLPLVVFFLLTRNGWIDLRSVGIKTLFTEFNWYFACYVIVLIGIPVCLIQSMHNYLNKFTRRITGQKATAAQQLANLLPLLALCALITVTLSQVVLQIEKRNYIRQDRLFFAPDIVFSSPEDVTTRELQQWNAKILDPN